MKIDAWKPKFIQALRNSANVRASCQIAGITRQAAYAARKKSTKFAAEWDTAIDEAVDTLEAAAWMRARDGVRRTEPLMYQGVQVAEKIITEYSDTLMVTLLKAHRPEKYRERVDVTVKDMRERAETAVQQFIERTGKSRDEAIEFLKPHIPQISQLIH